MTHNLLVASAILSGLAVGFVPALVDSLRSAVATRLSLSEGRADVILRGFYLVWLPGMPAAGWLLDHRYHKEVFYLGLLGMVLGVAWLALVQSVGALVGSMAVLGLAYSAVAVATVRLMADVLYFSQEVSVIAALNVGFIFVALGAVVGPWVVEFLLRRCGYRQGLLYLSFVFLVPAALVIGVAKRHFPAAPAEGVAWGAVLGDARLWLIGGIILLYFAIENCFEDWPEPYLLQLGYRDRGLTRTLLLFWGVFTLARLAMGWLPHTGYEIWLLLLLTIVAGMAVGNLVGAHERTSGTLGFLVGGACYGPLLPGFLGLVLLFFPETPGTALGVMLCLSGLDTVIMRPVMTSLAKHRPARTVMAVPAVLAIIMAAPLLILALIYGQ